MDAERAAQSEAIRASQKALDAETAHGKLPFTGFTAETTAPTALEPQVTAKVAAAPGASSQQPRAWQWGDMVKIAMPKHKYFGCEAQIVKVQSKAAQVELCSGEHTRQKIKVSLSVLGLHHPAVQGKPEDVKAIGLGPKSLAALPSACASSSASAGAQSAAAASAQELPKRTAITAEGLYGDDALSELPNPSPSA